MQITREWQSRHASLSARSAPDDIQYRIFFLSHLQHLYSWNINPISRSLSNQSKNSTMVMTTMSASRAWVLCYWLSCAVLSVQSFVPAAASGRRGSIISVQPFVATKSGPTSLPRPGQGVLNAFYDDAGSGPSDSAYSADLQGKKTLAVDEKEEDDKIRGALKRELLLFSSVTNRGEYATPDEQNILVDLVSQLEALNPTANPSSNCEGEWDLCLSSTQFFRSSPFFQSIRVAMGDSNKGMAETGFEIHDLATTASRVGRVRQTITRDKLVSEVDLEVGLVPGLPVRVKGTVISTASLQIVSPETWETRIENSQIKGSNIPLFNQMLELDLPVRDVFTTILGDTPVVLLKTYYVDESIRITRDVDDNFYVFSRS